MNTYKIYKVDNYNKTSHNDINMYASNDINTIIQQLNDNCGYHLLLFKNIKYKVFLDIDNVSDEEQFQRFIRFIDIDYELDFTSMSYTKSTNKNNLLSYHVVYFKSYGYLHNIKALCDDIKNNEYYKENFNGIIDTSVYKNNKWFRLPNQTNQNKLNKHIIVKGNMEDFIFNYCPLYNNIDNETDTNNVNETKLEKYGIKKIRYFDNTKYNYEIDDNIVEKCLNNLDDEYVEEWVGAKGSTLKALLFEEQWFKVTNCLKNLNKKHLWNKWSKNGSSYNYWKNIKQWNGQKKRNIFS